MRQSTERKWFASARGVVNLVILGETDKTYVVCSPEEYRRAQREGREPCRVGFRKSDEVPRNRKLRS